MINRHSTSFRHRVFLAGAWSVSGYALSTIIRFGTNLLMTRLLAPEMFGVMSIATTVMVGLAMFSDVGLKQSVVQNLRGSQADFLNTAWVTQIVRGFVLWLSAAGVALMILALNRAELLASWSVYASPDLPYVILIAATTAIFAGFESTKLFEASRDISLGRVTYIDIGSQLIGLAIMLAWVSVDHSIWVLVAGGVSSSLSRMILSHVWLRGTSNSFSWNSAAFSEIVKFGRWVFLASILGFFVINGDRLQIGALVDSKTFGVYVIAALTFGAIEQIFVKVISDVSFPALSEIARQRSTELRRKYYQFRLLFSCLANVSAGALLVCGAALVSKMYDHRYMDAGWMLQTLAPCLLAAPFQVSSQCFVAVGDSRALSLLAAVRFVALFAFLTSGFCLGGLQGALWGIVLSRLSNLPLTFYYKAKHSILDVRMEAKLLLFMIPGVIVGFGIDRLIAK
ncbi:oligosaccharide flippase family protein [Bradyrhizobium sp. WSM1417]|uniref:oligosaccharide flippase family protein n=1 Tax=Bradyrhizobium sp. WSM1417 TaxID=754500 RepID=UPI0004B90046|nr:oligosaccharide flippase family protein [Bradyrhizobium sp. WSM1417]